MAPPRGYSINQVVEMLNSEHIRDLSEDMKRSAVLMALDAAGTSIEQLQKDAKTRMPSIPTKLSSGSRWRRSGQGKRKRLSKFRQRWRA
jgi:hypothetical protein